MLSPTPSALAEGLWDLSLEELLNVRITTIASGSETPLDKAAAVVTVISSEDIEAMGARDIEEVLETVPGMHISKNPVVYIPKFNIRGITSTHTAQTLILINGIPISSLYLGHPSLTWAGMPVKGIKKIEVIRGPGSALYGADAFAGVINISTKGAKDIQGGTVGASGGSFGSKGGWVSYGNTESDINIGFTLEYNATDGFEETIEEDAQTLLDTITDTTASLAPGPVNTGKKMIDMRLELAQEEWTFRLGYQGRDDAETGAGVAQALSPTALFSSDRINTDFTYSFNNLSPGWALNSRLSYYYNDQQAETDNILFPAGTNTIYPLVPPNAPAFPDGAIGNPEFREEQARINFDAQYTDLQDHIISLGAGYFWGDIYEVTEQKNFDFALNPRPGGLEEVADTTEAYLPEEDRTNRSLYLQDEWQFKDNWVLTSGIRYDDYSDVGETVNPRLALVWATTDSITTKFLYGRAFRTPTIAELFIGGNPVSQGNPDLDPETIDTYELALSHQVSSDLHYSANIYYYDIDDFIAFVPEPITGVLITQNIDKIKGRGFEYEMSYQALSNLRVLGNYAYQKSTNKTTSSDVGETPHHTLYLRSEWTVADAWRLNTQLNWVGTQDRAFGDSRPKVPSSTTVDFILGKGNILPELDVALTIRNAFDEDVFEASPPASAPFTTPFVPKDFPMAGRSIYGELSYRF
jgi:iron complex outermembrane receptor protein